MALPCHSGKSIPAPDIGRKDIPFQNYPLTKKLLIPANYCSNGLRLKTVLSFRSSWICVKKSVVPFQMLLKNPENG